MDKSEWSGSSPRLYFPEVKRETTHIDGIAYTAGPGLVSALLVRASLNDETRARLATHWRIKQVHLVETP